MKKKNYPIRTILLSMLMLTLLHSTEKIAPEEKKKEFARQLSPIKTRITTKGMTFSFSKAKKELDDLYDTAQSIGIGSSELCEWYDIYTLLLSKKDSEAYRIIPYGTKYIQECIQSPYPSKNILPFIHYRMYRAYSAIDGSIAARTKHFKKFLILWEAQKLYNSPSQLLGQKEQLAYLLQENKEHAAALNLNLNIETKARKLGLDEEKFMTLYNNTAQNYYDLKDFMHAKKYLEKRLDVSRKYGYIRIELNTLFQLAVLAYETKHTQEAETLFRLRLTIANTHPGEVDKKSIEEIRRDLDTFYRKIR